MNPYLKEYKWSNIGAMLKNNKATPKIENRDFRGNLVVITGATSGIGYETARLYASHGSDLLLINRNKEKSEKLVQEIKKDFNVPCTYFIADFAHLDQVHAAAEMLSNLDRDIEVLIHNAGVYNTKRRFTSDDIEEVFQVNYLASFIINHSLKEKLEKPETSPYHPGELRRTSVRHRWPTPRGPTLGPPPLYGLEELWLGQDGTTALHVRILPLLRKKQDYHQCHASRRCKDRHGRKQRSPI